MGSLSLRSVAEGGKRGAGLFIYCLKPVPEIVGEVLTEWKSTAASALLHLCKCFTEGQILLFCPSGGYQSCVQRLKSQISSTPASFLPGTCHVLGVFLLSLPLSLWADYHPLHLQRSFSQQ